MDTHQPRPPSEADTKSQMSLSAASPDHARVSVQLSNGIKMLIPIHQASQVQDLHKKAVARAGGFGVHTTVENSFLQTSGQNVVALCGEDLLQDVWDWTENATFELRNLQQQPAASLTSIFEMQSLYPEANNTLTSSPTTKSALIAAPSMVYIQLYTLEETISSTKLSTIDKEVLTFPDDTQLSQLHDTVAARFQQSSSQITQDNNGVQLKPPRVNLYLQKCRLAAENNLTLLRDLKLTGSKTAPLHIFVDLDHSDSSLSSEKLPEDAKLKDLWGFTTTRRGVCTLLTSLEILIQDIKFQQDAVDDFMRSLLETTRFPPLVLAFQTMCDYHTNYKLRLPKMRMLAWAIHLLCLQTAPAWVCKSPDNALEASRQVLAWLCSLRPHSYKKKDQDKDTDKEYTPILRSAQIWSKDDKDTDGWYSSLPNTFYIDLLVNVSTSSGNSKAVGVNLSEDDKAIATFIGHALYDNNSASKEYYFDSNMDWKSLFDQEKVFPPQPSEFNSLLESTATSIKLQMIGPDKLAKCISKDLPIITLGPTGYVTVYDQEDYECGQQRFFTWNAVDGKEIMTKGNPGQYLMQKVTPIMTERQAAGTWVVDAWSDWTTQADFGAPEEAIVVCMDTSYSMNTAMPSTWLNSDSGATVGALPSRLTEVKEFFKNLAARVSALQLSTYLGLVTFSSSHLITTRQELTPVHLDFEDQMDLIKPQSQTAIYDGIEHARQMLCKLQKEHKGVKCRIVVLTDGMDNESKADPFSVAQQLRFDNIVLDSIVIGTGIRWSTGLFKISRCTGGYAFAPAAQRTFFQIFLLETMVDIRTRPDIVQVPADAAGWTLFAPKDDDMKDTYHFPPSRPHPNQNDYFIALKDAERFLSRYKGSPLSKTPSVHSSMTRTTSIHSSITRTTSSAYSSTTLGSSGASRVILAEIKEMANHPHPFMDVYVSESNMGFWIIAMDGPPESPYSKGTFKLYLELGADFPSRPPSARFITPMLHPNITKHGRICHPILDREWTATTRVYEVLQHIWGILVSLEARDAVDPLSTLKFWTDPAQGRIEVERYVSHFATQTRAAIAEELRDNDSSTICSSAASIKSVSTVTGGKTIATPTSSVASSTSPPSNPSRTAQRPALLSSLLALRSNRAASATPPPPLMTMPGQGTTATTPQGQNRDADEISNAGSVVSDASKGSSRRRSFFKKLSK